MYRIAEQTAVNSAKGAGLVAFRCNQKDSCETRPYRYILPKKRCEGTLYK